MFIVKLFSGVTKPLEEFVNVFCIKIQVIQEGHKYLMKSPSCFELSKTQTNWKNLLHFCGLLRKPEHFLSVYVSLQ